MQLHKNKPQDLIAYIEKMIQSLIDVTMKTVIHQILMDTVLINL